MLTFLIAAKIKIRKETEKVIFPSSIGMKKKNAWANFFSGRYSIHHQIILAWNHYCLNYYWPQQI